MDNDSTDSTTEVELALHQGEAFWIVANTYPDIPRTIVEMIQNGVDAGADTVVVAVDQKQSLITVADNGDGVSVDKFNEALRSVSRTIKHKKTKSVTPGEKRRIQMGQFGRGMISPLDKCRAFRITSQPKGSDRTTSWTFVGERIHQMQSNITIPQTTVSRMPEFIPPFRTRTRRLGVKWQTFVELDSVTADKVVRSIDIGELVSRIRTSLRTGMLANGTTVHLLISNDGVDVDARRVNAMEFTGEPLPIVEEDGGKAGQVRFEMFRANKNRSGNRDGTIMFAQTGSDSQIPLDKKFLMQVIGGRNYGPYADAFKALESGYFEGLITGENLKLDAGRVQFIVDDAMRDFYLSIGVWYEYHGRHHVETEQEVQRDERYQRLSLESLDMLLSSAVDDQSLSAVLDSLEGVSSNPARKPRSTTGNEATKPKTKRRTVRSSKPREATGGVGKKEPAKLQFALEQRPTWDDLWKLDFDSATIVFNTLHAEWTKLDDTHSKRTTKNDRQIVHLQLWIGLEVLMLLRQHSDPESFEAARHTIDSRIKHYAQTIIAKMH